MICPVTMILGDIFCGARIKRSEWLGSTVASNELVTYYTTQ